MKAESKPTARSNIADEIELIAQVLGIDTVDANMARITGVSPENLSRARNGRMPLRDRRHITTVAAIAREVLTLMESVTGSREVDSAASRRWLCEGEVNLHGQSCRPIDALADEGLSVDLLADLRHANDR